MEVSEHSSSPEDAFQQVSLGEPTPRRLSTAASPSPPLEPSLTANNSTTATEAAVEQSHDNVGEEGWQEPELGFSSISLNDNDQDQEHSSAQDRRRGSVVSVSSSSVTRNDSQQSTTSTIATTLAPSSPTSSRSPPRQTSDHQRTTDKQSTTTTEQRQTNSTMSRPPDSSKIEQPSPTPTKPRKSPSVMQKVMSMTRQRDLPPKNREEEEKHLKQLADMLSASKEIEKRRKIELEQKAQTRSALLASALPTWESSILPNYRVVNHSTSEGRRLHKLWWDGTMPVRFRGRLWSLCIGNGLAVSKNAFGNALERAKKGLGSGSEEFIKFKRDAEEDMEGVLKGLKLFQKEGGVMHQDLLEVLLAWSVRDGDRPIYRYPKGIAYPASLLLVNLPPQDAYISLLNLISKSYLSSFYSSTTSSESAVHSYERVFDTLLADSMPKIYSNFSSLTLRPSTYLLPWLSTLFIGFLPLELTTRLIDVWFLEGNKDSFMFKIALVLLKILEPRLFNPNLEELELVFKGKDQGARAIVKREKGLLALPGHEDEQQSVEGDVEVEEVYTVMGCTEERVFEELENMDWKEETWDRLVERELPDAD